MSTLPELQRDYFLAILENVKTDHNIKFLVVDEIVDRLMDYLFVDRNELLRHVSAVDRIDSPKRKGQGSVDVIYFVQPSRFTINCMDADFSNRPPKYKRAHIRFLPGFDSTLFKHFKSCQYVTQYLVGLEVTNIAFYPKEFNYFESASLDRPLQIFFNPSCKDLVDSSIEKTIQTLLNICVITGEYPIVRYSEPTAEEYALNEATLIVKRLAFEFQEKLDEYVRRNEHFPPESTRPRSILIITDRSLDLFSPLLHEFTYQAMAFEVSKNIDKGNNVYNYKVENEAGTFEEKKSNLMDICDPDWVDAKYLHIADASEFLTSKVNELIAKNPLLVDRAKVKDTSDLLNVVAHLKDFDEERRRIALHRTLLDECFDASKTFDLPQQAELEQKLAGYGLQFDGEKCRNLADELVLQLVSKSASVTDKVRLILEYALYRGGLIELDFIKLLSFIGVDRENNWFNHFMILFENFRYLGFKLVKDKPKSKPFQKEWTHDTIVNDPTIYQTSRYVPSVGNIISKVITNPLLLNEAHFPYVKDKPIELLDPEVAATMNSNSTSTTSLKNPRHKAVWAKTNVHSKEVRQRIFYYVLGGVTYSEIRAANEQAKLKNRDIFIGSDCIWTPLQFMSNVEDLTKPRRSLRLSSDGPLREEAPDFLFDKNFVEPAASKHIHTVSQQIPSKASSRVVEPPEESSAKKSGKLSRFLKRK